MRLLSLALFGLALCLGVVGTVVSGADPVFAQGAPGVILDIGPATVSLIEWLAPLILVVLAGLCLWLLLKVTTMVGLKVSALQRAVIEQGLERAIGYAISKFGDRAAGGIPITVKSDAVAVAVGYALTAIPGALKYFKKSRDDLADMIEARLGDALVDPSVERNDAVGVLGVATGSKWD